MIYNRDVQTSRMAQPVINNITRSLRDCGVDIDSGGVIWNRESASQRITNGVFNNCFNTCIDITFAELDDHWKTYSSLTVADGHIRLRPGTKVNIRVFVQWTRDKLRTNEDPAAEMFPVALRKDLVYHYNTHKQWVSDASDMAKSARPKMFAEKMKWSDWKVTLLNFLKSQPGRYGVPLSYVIRSDNLVIQNTYANFLDEYAAKAPLQGRAFDHDASKVHSYIICFISENNVAEQKVLPFKDDNNGRLDYIALRDFYEGVVTNTRATLSAEADL